MESTAAQRNYHIWVLALIGTLMLARLFGLGLSPLGLHGDEAQYWAWSKSLDWGYFTKPPVIAWIIFATTSLFGDAEWAIRLSSPILHSVTAYVIFFTARFLYDARTGFWAGLIYITMPGVWLSSGIVNTDVPLLLSFAIALNAWAHLRVKASWPRALQLGLAVGIGILAKYAMLFFLPALGLAFLFDPSTRKSLNTLKGYAAGAIAILLVVPNIIWNINHDFATLSHTAANANIQSGIPFHPMELINFWLDQLAVFGPVTLVLYVLAMIAAFRKKLAPPAFWIAAFGASPLIIISIEAILSRANANWASTAYIAGAILTAHYGLYLWDKLRKWLTGGVALNIILGSFVTIMGLVPSWANALGLANSFKHMRGWPETIAAIEARLEQGHEGQAYQTLAVDKRIIFYDIVYYGGNLPVPLKMWRLEDYPQNHAEMTAPLKPLSGDPVLIINYHENHQDKLREDFERLEPLPPLDIDLGGGKRRTLDMWAGYGFKRDTDN